ncbi:hypothetical protein [Devosia nitrariae]|uniref:hypothetical protein n=1 Tax=Devosia nitrariae TaxID=2071872 RepID=UPI0024E098F6|nr:hypothetical protein [Devosia nitrariae]
MLNQSLTPRVSRIDTVNRSFCQCAASNPACGRAPFVNRQKRFEMEAFTFASHLDSKGLSAVDFHSLATKLNGNPLAGRLETSLLYPLVANHEFDPPHAVGNKR